MSLYLECATSKEISLVVYFIYQGEVQIYQEKLNGFLDVAEKLKLDGFQSDVEKTEDLVRHETKQEKLNDTRARI